MGYYCVVLKKIGTFIVQAISLEVCRHMGMTLDSRKYCFDWYSYLGLDLAQGMSFSDIRSSFEKIKDNMPFMAGKLIKIVDFLEANFTVECFSRRG